MITIKEITLLSAEEYERYKRVSAVSKYYDLWWLCSQGTDETSVAYVYNGAVFRSGYRYDSTILSVRPALRLNAKYDPFDYFVGDELELLGLKWTILDIRGDDLFVLCNDIVARRRFDLKSNVWKTSELKSWLEEWLEYVVMGLDDVVYDAVTFDKRPGDICRIGKRDMIVLEDRDGECLLLSKDLYRRSVAFGDTNYFGTSDARKICSEFAIEIAEAVGFENIVSHAVDLTSHDGDEKYGKVYSCVSLLTNDMYKHYKDIIDTYRVDQIWWLSTPKHSSDTTSHAVSCVWPDGDTGYSYSLNSRFLGLRPFCVVKTAALS